VINIHLILSMKL